MVDLDAKSKVHFWIDFDATYQGDLRAKYDIDLLQRDVLVGHATCEPVPLSHAARVCSFRSEIGDSHQLRCRTDCQARVSSSGPTLVRATLSIQGKPASLTLTRADLLIKQ